MIKKKISILCIILSFTMVISTATPVFAAISATSVTSATSIQEQELITKAENALKEAEKYLLIGYVDVAKSFVNQLKDGSVKDGFLLRIEKIEKAIASSIETANKEKLDEATKAVEKYEKSLKREDLSGAQKLVNALPECAIKTSLKTRLTEAQNKAMAYEKIQTAITAVEKANNTLQESDLKNAISLVSKLEDCPEKIELLSKIEKIKIAMENVDVERASRALEAVKKAEASSKREDYNTAQSLVIKLPKGDIRTNLESRLKIVLENVKKAELLEKETSAENEKIKKATEAVTKLESSLSSSDLSSAVSLVDKLKEGDTKKALKARIEKAKEKIKYADQAKIDEATNAVIASENTLMKELYDRAKTLVSKLQNSEPKKALEQRLKVLQPKIAENESNKDKINKIQLKYCKEQIDIFEKKPSVDQIGSIETLLNILKDNSEKTKLAERFKTLKNFFVSKLENKAKYDIKVAKKLKTDKSISIARNSVSLLPEGTLKNDLYKELNYIK